MPNDPYSEAQAAYAVLKKSVDERFPHGHYVAITSGKVVADAESIEALRATLSVIGMDLHDVVVVQAGVEPVTRYLGFIATTALIGHWIKCVLPAGS
jgi:hypothetical protein